MKKLRINFKAILLFLVLLIPSKNIYNKKVLKRYPEAEEAHLFWHPIYLGLLYHPSHFEENGEKWWEDSTTYALYEKHNKQFPTEEKSKDFNNKKFESFLKQETFNFIAEKPWYSLKNYFYKAYRIFIIPFDSTYPLGRALFYWPTFLFLAIWACIKTSKRETLILLVPLTLFSSLPMFMYAPEHYIASDYIICFMMLLSFFLLSVKDFVLQKLKPKLGASV